MIEVFGTPEEGIRYSPRPGAYCVLFDDLGQIAAVEVSGKRLLPGGGIEAGESAAIALEREFREETGLMPLDPQPMGQTGEYMKTLDGLRSEYVIAHLFYATAHRVVGIPSEIDHAVVWLDQQMALSSLFRPGQRWAVREAIRLLGRGKEEPPSRLRSAVILVQGRKVALIRRDRAGQTYYLFPGGGVEHQETLEQAAIREAQEELGVHVEVEGLAAIVRFHDTPSSGKAQCYFHAHIVGGEFGSGDGEELASEESSEAGSYHPVWLALDELYMHDVRPVALSEALQKGALVKGVVLEIEE